jgi:exopolyphosphatase/pppGpp-phosphohydrolase
MRLGVLDVGSNTVHLLVVDAHQGGRPLPAFSHKAEIRLGENMDSADRLSDDCAQQLREFVQESLRIAEDKGVHKMLAFATSAVRGRRGPPDLPCRPPLVRLVSRAAADARHRRRVAGDRVRARRGA